MIQHISHSEADTKKTDALVSSAEIMRALGISRPTFNRMAHDGRLPVIRVGWHWKMARSVLHEYMLGQHASQHARSKRAGVK